MDPTLLSQALNSKTRIFNAFCRLLQTKHIDAITVKEICAEANVGKSTFYAYFKDKYAIMQWYSELAYEIGVNEIGRTCTWEEGHRLTTSAILKKQSVLHRAAQSNDYNSLGLFSPRCREKTIIETIVRYKGIPLTEVIHCQVVAYTAGELAVTKRFFADKTEDSLDMLVDVMTSIVPKELYELLKTPSSLPADSQTLQRKQFELFVLQSDNGLL